MKNLYINTYNEYILISRHQRRHRTSLSAHPRSHRLSPPSTHSVSVIIRWSGLSIGVHKERSSWTSSASSIGLCSAGLLSGASWILS
jgi:hypothetical protein